MSSTRSPPLKTLQTSPNGVHLVGKRRTPAKRKESSTKKLTDFLPKIDDEKTKESKCKSVDVGTTTDSLITTREQCSETEIALPLTEESTTSPVDIVKMLCSPEPSAEYWKALAEERRLALDETLRENLGCYQQIAILREENRRLERLAEEGKELARILRSALDGAEDDESEETTVTSPSATNSDCVQ